MAIVDPKPDCAQSKPRDPVRPPHGKCRLTLRIDGTAYHVGPHRSHRPFASVKAFWLRKASDGVECIVGQTLTGMTCTCPAFQMWQGPPTCKHVRALVAAGLLDSEAPPPQIRLYAPKEPTLAEMTQHEADSYRTLGTPEGMLFARTLDELALKIRMTAATTPDDYEARIEILDADVRQRWQAIGYEEGRHAGCRCGENARD